jgi:hypothetical protein
MANDNQGKQGQNQDRKGFGSLNDAERGGQGGNNAQGSQQGKESQNAGNDSRRMGNTDSREDRSGS